MSFQTINPFTQQVLKTYTFLSSEQLQEALSLASTSYSSWKVTSIAHRKALMQRVIDLLGTQKEAHALLITQEMGKPFTEAIAEVEKCMLLCQYYLEQAEAFLHPTPLALSDKTVEIRYETTGAVFGIMPWNYPYWQVFRYLIPNILAGNAVLLKHAPNVMGCGQAMQNLFLAAGFPAGVFQSLIIDIPQVEAVIAHPVVQGVCLTGSVKAGSAVAALAGKYLKKSVMELGSSDPFIILPDASLSAALTAAFQSRLSNAGQTCIAAKRVYIHQSQLEESLQFLQEKIAGLQLGNPVHPATTLGPISKLEFVKQLEAQMEKALAHGSKLIVGGKAVGAFFQPTILVSQQDNPINKEEVFGPVLNLIPYEQEEVLTNWANDTPFGLAAAIWGTDLEKANRLATQVAAGNVVINDFSKSDPRIPFGGIKQSGYGREMGEAGFKSFLNEKAVVYAG